MATKSKIPDVSPLDRSPATDALGRRTAEQVLADIVGQTGYPGLLKALRMFGAGASSSEGIVADAKLIIERHKAVDDAEQKRWHAASKKAFPPESKRGAIAVGKRATVISTPKGTKAKRVAVDPHPMSMAGYVIYDSKRPARLEDIPPGTGVLHKVFGTGTVDSHSATGSYVRIRFDRHGTKEMVFSFCRNNLNVIGSAPATK